jgi:type IV pilus assembly protein PilV
MERFPVGYLPRCAAAPTVLVALKSGLGAVALGRARAAGFSLVEVLVAVLVLSIGLLGLAALQIAGSRASDSTRFRTTATLAAYDVAERLRADPGSFFPLGQASSDTFAIAFDACPGDDGDAGGAIGRWRQDFCALALPPPSSGDFARVDCRDTNDCGGGNCAIVVRWDDGRGDRQTPQGGETVASIHQFRFCTRIATAI